MKKKILIALAIMLVAVAVWRFFSELRAISQEPVTSWVIDANGDCAVVLTGGKNRIREGFDLLARGEIRKLIISGVYPGATLREIFPQWPYYGELDEKDVILEKRSRTTYGNAVQAQPLIEALYCRDLVLVTSSIHMRRAKRTFEAVFPKDFTIIGHSVLAGNREELPSFVLIEAFRSLFYSFWAY
jgi:uncharacterized SAM-binding protein YcdF (DUF218 family)